MADAQAPRDSHRERGAIESFSALLASLSGYLQARLELASLEGKDAAIRLVLCLLFVGMAAVLLLGGYVFGVILFYLLVQSWLGLSDLWMTGIFLLAHLLGAVLALLLAKNRLNGPFFPYSLEQLARDREWLNRAKPPESPKN